MNLTFETISQPIVSLLAFRNGAALVQLANKRVAVLPGPTLSAYGINPSDCKPGETVASRLASMRVSIVGKHAALRRDGGTLFVSDLLEEPISVLMVTDDNVTEICSHIARGGDLTKEMKQVVGFLKSRERHVILGPLYERLKAAFDAPRTELAGMVSLFDSPARARVRAARETSVDQRSDGYPMTLVGAQL